jgi:hypothetical protein
VRKKVYHGVSIGILMMDTSFERFPGDVGNARTWPFPVAYKVVRGAVPDRVTSRDGDEALLGPFKAAADELVAEGVDGIATTCGFLALYQKQLSAHCPVPVAASALLQLPMVQRILPGGQRPAVLTFSAESLSRDHLEGAGADPDTPVFGMPATSHFQRSIRAGDTTVTRDTLRVEVLEVARRAVARDASIGALVLECTNMSPYASDIARELGMPVFDIVTLVHWFHRSLRPEVFPPL